MPDDKSQALLPRNRQPAGGAGVLSAVVSLTKTCIGTGVVALPYAVLQGGLLSLPGLVLLGAWNWRCSQLLLRARAALASSPALTGPPPALSTLSELCFSAFGPRGASVFDGALGALLLGVCASYTIQASQLLSAVAGQPYPLCVAGCTVVLVPLVLQRTLARLSLVSAAGLAVLTGGLLTVGRYGWARYGPPPSLAWLWRLPEPSSFALFFGVAAFSFGVQSVLLAVQDNMREPRRAGEASAYAHVAVVAFYALTGVGLAALFAYSPDSVQPLVIINLPRPSLLSSGVQLASAAVSLLSYPMPMLPVVQMLLAPRAAGAYESRGGRSGGAGDCATRLGFLGATSAIALLLPDFAHFAGCLGCLTVALFNVLPPLLHLRLCSWPADGPRRLAAALVDVAFAVVGAAVFLFVAAGVGSKLIAPAAGGL